MEIIKILYHGTCEEYARQLLSRGWQPSLISAGGNQGQSRYLYLTTLYDNAMWFANEKGCNVVLALRDVPLSHLAVDPEDGVAQTIEQEISHPLGLPGNLVLTKPLSSKHFSRVLKT